MCQRVYSAAELCALQFFLLDDGCVRGRGTETEEKVRERLETAKRELPYAPQYDYQIINGGDIEAAYQSLREVFLKSTGEA